MQVLAEYFSACGDVVAVRLGEKTVPQQLTIKAWIEFRSQHAARTAKEYDQTVRGATCFASKKLLMSSAAVSALIKLHCKLDL